MISSKVMHRLLRWLVALGLLLVCAVAAAQQGDFERVVANLHHEDFRVRTQAALAIWQSGTEAGGSLVEWALAELPAPANDAGKPIASDNKEADHDR